MDATYTVVDSKKKEGNTNEKRCIQSCNNKIQMIEPFSNPKSEKEGIACPQPPQREVEK